MLVLAALSVKSTQPGVAGIERHPDDCHALYLPVFKKASASWRRLLRGVGGWVASDPDDQRSTLRQI